MSSPISFPKRIVRWLVLCASVACAACLLGGCATEAGSQTGCESQEAQATSACSSAPTPDSGRWNDADAQRIADEMIRDMVNGSWLQQWTQDHDGKPTVILGPIDSKTSPSIDAEPVIRNIERNLFNAKTIQDDLKSGKKIRRALREERVHQNCRGQTTSAAGGASEFGADFMVYGTIRSTVEEERKNDAVLLYTVDLELINLETNVKSWEQKTEFKKIVAQQELEVPPTPPKDSGRSTAGMQQGGC